MESVDPVLHLAQALADSGLTDLPERVDNLQRLVVALSAENDQLRAACEQWKTSTEQLTAQVRRLADEMRQPRPGDERLAQAIENWSRSAAEMGKGLTATLSLPPEVAERLGPVSVSSPVTVDGGSFAQALSNLLPALERLAERRPIINWQPPASDERRALTEAVKEMPAPQVNVDNSAVAKALKLLVKAQREQAERQEQMQDHLAKALADLKARPPEAPAPATKRKSVKKMVEQFDGSWTIETVEGD